MCDLGAPWCGTLLSLLHNLLLLFDCLCILLINSRLFVLDKDNVLIFHLFHHVLISLLSPSTEEE